ncbi:MAG: YkgJ family cysteine cluster protein [Aureliella sp.]
MAKKKLCRADVPAGDCLCDHCTAKCCRYFALAIDKPEERRDFDFMRWYLLHDRASVFVEDDSWYLLVHTTCKHLQSDHRCGIYHTRPQICRDYTTDACEFDEDGVYDHYFETAEQVVEYVEATLDHEDWSNIRSPEPALLPILNG